MKNRLVAYFSASGKTKNVAKADLQEIKPIEPYTKANLDWLNKDSRSSKEMSHKAFRPTILGEDLDVSEYDEIILGFPIWWQWIWKYGERIEIICAQQYYPRRENIKSYQ